MNEREYNCVIYVDHYIGRLIFYNNENKNKKFGDLGFFPFFFFFLILFFFPFFSENGGGREQGLIFPAFFFETFAAIIQVRYCYFSSIFSPCGLYFVKLSFNECLS